MARFAVYPIKETGKSSVGIVEFNRENEIIGRYGIYIGNGSHTDVFRTYSKFIMERLEDDEQCVVQTFHQTVRKKRWEFPRLTYVVIKDIKRYSYCWKAAKVAQVTHTETHEIMKEVNDNDEFYT